MTLEEKKKDSVSYTSKSTRAPGVSPNYGFSTTAKGDKFALMFNDGNEDVLLGTYDNHTELQQAQAQVEKEIRANYRNHGVDMQKPIGYDIEQDSSGQYVTTVDDSHFGKLVIGTYKTEKEAKWSIDMHNRTFDKEERMDTTGHELPPEPSIAGYSVDPIKEESSKQVLRFDGDIIGTYNTDEEVSAGVMAHRRRSEITPDNNKEITDNNQKKKKMAEERENNKEEAAIIAFSMQGVDKDGNTQIIDYQLKKNENRIDRTGTKREGESQVGGILSGKRRGELFVETIYVPEQVYRRAFTGEVGSEQALQEFMENESYEKDLVIKTVPNKFKFENQKTTDHIITTPSNNKDDGLIAFGYRVFAPIGWGFAGGMIESDEDAKANSEKEIDEEMSIRPQDVVSSTSLGNYDVEEVRGTANTALFMLEVTEERMRTLEAGSDVEETMILDKKELEEFLKNRSNEMVPHHLDMLIEQARRGNIPSWASKVITGVFPDNNQNKNKEYSKKENKMTEEVKEEQTNEVQDNNQIGIVDELRDFASQMGISPQGNTKEFRELVVDYIQKKAVGVFDMSSTTATQLLGKPEATAEYQSMLDEAFTAFEFNDAESNDMLKFASTPDKMKEMDEKYFRKSENFREIQKEYRGQGGSLTSEKAAGFYKAQADKQEEDSPKTQEEVLQLIKDNQESIDDVTEVFEKTEVPVMQIKDLYTEDELGKLDNAKYTEAYKAGKWTSLQKDSKDMYPIGGSEDWPSVDEIKANPTEEFYIVKGEQGEDIVMYKKQDRPNLLNLSDPEVIDILGNLTELEQPATWGEGVLKVKEGGAYLCMNDKDGEVYLIQKDENGNPESYQKVHKDDGMSIDQAREKINDGTITAKDPAKKKQDGSKDR